MDRDSILRAHVLKHPPEPVIGHGRDQVRHDAELGATERRRHGVAAERDRICRRDMLLVAGRHVIGDKGNVDIGLSDEKGLHSFSVADGVVPAASYISTAYTRSFAEIIRKAIALTA